MACAVKKREENPLQGKLFMSAREILATHDPNEPDRYFFGTNVGAGNGRIGRYMRNSPDPREGQPTHRAERTDSTPNDKRTFGLGNNPDPHPDKPYSRPFRDIKVEVPPETNQQLWDRKKSESDESGLTSRIKTEGVQMPVMLATETQGRTGKPNIAGGHHRVAVMNNLNPDQLMPVMPVNHVLGAKSMESQIEAESAKRKRSR